MASFNRVVLMGNVTRDIELRYITSGTAVCDLTLALNNRRKNAQGEWIEEAVFVDCTLWGRTAEIAKEYLTKGSPVLIEGRLKMDRWETPDGQKKSKLSVVADSMQLIGGRGGGGGGGSAGGGGSGAASGPPRASGGSRTSSNYSKPAPPEDYGPPPEGEEDIPF